MVIFKQVADLQKYLQNLQTRDLSIGFVPTMGALHQGHISLLAQSKAVAHRTVSSIFVNPTQFNNPEDFKKYPVTIEQDIYQLEKAGCDILFLPGTNEIYPGENMQPVSFELEYLEETLEGKFRPGHFQGVCMVVKRLLQIVNPSYLFAGQKDYQQCLVLQRLLQIIKSAAKLVICATTREADGLAMSSRNLRLTSEERALAPEIFRTLLLVKKHIARGNLRQVKANGVNILVNKGFKVDYLEVALAEDLHVIDDWDGIQPIVIVVAAYLNNIRLIDNLKY